MVSPDSLHLSLTLPSNLKMLDATIDNITCKLEEAGLYDGESIQKISLSLYEAVVNGIEHGNLNDQSKMVKIEMTTDKNSVTFIVQDEGEGFNIDDVPNPMALENINCKRGRGIYLMKSFMDEVLYNEQGNSVTIKKNRSKTE